MGKDTHTASVFNTPPQLKYDITREQCNYQPLSCVIAALNYSPVGTGPPAVCGGR